MAKQKSSEFHHTARLGRNMPKQSKYALNKEKARKFYSYQN
jgi:hypothetical protein